MPTVFKFHELLSKNAILKTRVPGGCVLVASHFFGKHTFSVLLNDSQNLEEFNKRRGVGMYAELNIACGNVSNP
jgi:hypothetical protein